MEEKYLNRAEAAEYLTARGLRTSKTTLQKLVTVGGGPTYRKFGHFAVYAAPDLDKWAEERMSAPRRSSSDAAVPAAHQGVADLGPAL